jgi:23S rRNA pseudouridine2604 synthase
MNEIATMRLARRLAQETGCSRNEAQQYIEGGWVLVDGQVCEEPGVRVGPENRVVLAAGARAEAAPPVTLLFHKPVGTDTGPAGKPDAASILPSLTHATRSAADRSGIRPLKKHFAVLQLTDGLETQASGLLVLTQDWRVARRLVEDAARIEHEYIVDTGERVSDEQLARMNQGMQFNGKAVAGLKASRQSETRLRIVLKTPPRGLLERLCAEAGLGLVAMRRIRIGRLPLAGLEPGQWRYLAAYEKF